MESVAKNNFIDAAKTAFDVPKTEFFITFSLLLVTERQRALKSAEQKSFIAISHAVLHHTLSRRIEA